MLNLNRISPNADLCSEIKLLEVKMDILNKNILYVTHECDKIKKIVTSLENSSNLQKQVDEYFTEEPKDIPEVEQ